MIKSILVTISVLTSVMLYAQESGIRFESGNYAQALEKAKLEGKYLFIDCYTSWCVPCKKLEKEVFTDKEVADYFNSKFVNFRLDIEKGEGPELKQRFKVQPVPTLLFINAKGEVEHKFIGASSKEDFLKLTNEVFTKENRYGALQRRFKSGENNPEFLSLFIKELLDQGEFSSAKELLNKLIKTEPVENLCTSAFWPLLTHNFIAEQGSDIYMFLISNKELLTKNIGLKEYKETLTKIFIKYANIWIFNGSLNVKEEAFDNLKNDIRKLSLENEDEVLYVLKIAEARQKKDYDTFVLLLENAASNMKPGNTFSILINSRFFVQEGTKEQREKLSKIVNTFITTSNNNMYMQRLEPFAKELIKKQ